nr:AI-2E family transporter [uncultured Acetatifactor sp.]
MGFDKEKIKQIKGLMLWAAILVLIIIYSNAVVGGVVLAVNIAKPFLYGGAIAFVLNIPMRMIENKLLKKWKGKAAAKLKRPVSMILSILFVLFIITLVVSTVLPQVTATAAEVGRKIPEFAQQVIDMLDEFSQNYPELDKQVAKLERLQINWENLANSAIDFLKNGMTSMLTSTVTVASSIIGGVVNLFISLVFAIYILGQKEKLERQGRNIITAYFPKKAAGKILEVMALLYKNFSNFITGQCTEAVILGTMFVVAMTIFRMPYAFLVGVLIAFTALIPIVGAFIGCIVGAFLILIDDPILAVWFVVMFLVIQQIEGNLIYPKVVGNSVGLPSMWVLVAVSLGGSLFGVAGMLFFIPLFSTCYVLFRESVRSRNAEKCREEGAEAKAAVIAGSGNTKRLAKSQDEKNIDKKRSRNGTKNEGNNESV